MLSWSQKMRLVDVLFSVKRTAEETSGDLDKKKPRLEVFSGLLYGFVAHCTAEYSLDVCRKAV